MNTPDSDTDDDFDAVLADLRRLRDELRLKIHLAGMEARSAWSKLEPRLPELEKEIERAGEVAARSLRDAVCDLRTRLRTLRDDLAAQ